MKDVKWAKKLFGGLFGKAYKYGKGGVVLGVKGTKAGVGLGVKGAKAGAGLAYEGGKAGAGLAYEGGKAGVSLAGSQIKDSGLHNAAGYAIKIAK